MSLSEAILSVAEELEATDSKSLIVLRAVINNAAKQLRLIVKVNEGNTSAPSPYVFPFGGSPLSVAPEVQHRLEIEKAKQEFRKPSPQVIKIEEEYDGDMVEIVGSDPPSYTSINPQMAEGNYTSIDGKTYQLRSRKLHLISPTESNKS